MNKYPNNECSECPIWLAFEGTREEMIKLCEKRHCDLVNTEFECDGCCLNCDYFHEVCGCAINRVDMFINTNEASMALFHKLKRRDKCDVCGEVKDVVTAASIFGGSYSYCNDCLNKGAEPYHAMVDYIACVGHFPDDINNHYRALVMMALEGLGVSVEQFSKDVDNAIESMWRV